MKIKLIESDTNITSLQRQHDDAVRYVDRLEKVQQEQPGLIAEYQNMDRDYNVLRRNYEELLSRLQSANIAQAADTQADKVKLQIIDPPEIPRLPIAPNRMLLVTGVLLGGLDNRRGVNSFVWAARPVVCNRGRAAQSGSAGIGRYFGPGADIVPRTTDDGGSVWRGDRYACRSVRRSDGPYNAVGGADLMMSGIGAIGARC